MSDELSDIGLIGLAVMGQNLALNIADHGFKISVFNRTAAKTKLSLRRTRTRQLASLSELKDFIQSLKRPRKIVILVKAGDVTDATINSLLPFLEEGDIIIDGGNARWDDTIRREKDLKAQGFRFVDLVSLGAKKVHALAHLLCQVVTLSHGRNSSQFGQRLPQR